MFTHTHTHIYILIYIIYILIQASYHSVFVNKLGQVSQVLTLTKVLTSGKDIRIIIFC